MKLNTISIGVNVQADGIRVVKIGGHNCKLDTYTRRTFYKITLITSGNSCLKFADRSVEIDRPALVFTNPNIPFSWEGDSHQQQGIFCLFGPGFFDEIHATHEQIVHLFFEPGGNPVFLLDSTEATYLKSLFERMVLEAASDYSLKYNILRNYIYLIFHEALKMEPPTTYVKPKNAAGRLSKLFVQQIDNQFPINFPGQGMKYKKASDFADLFHIHVNYLNSVIHDVTGKSTTTLIQERLLNEAKRLLTQTNWDVSEISYSLSFENLSYFDRFFRKHMGTSPGTFRKNN